MHITESLIQLPPPILHLKKHRFARVAQVGLESLGKQILRMLQYSYAITVLAVD